MAKRQKKAVQHWTPKAREIFLKVLGRRGNVTAAAKAAGLVRNAAYNLRQADPKFAEAWDQAIEGVMDTCEAEAFRRGVEGVEEPVFHRGEVCGHIRKFSDALLLARLRAHRPAYRDRQDVNVNVNIDLAEKIKEARLRAGKQVNS